MADLVRRATLLWLDLRSVAAADPPSAEQRRQLEAYNSEHLAFVRKDPDNSVSRGRKCRNPHPFHRLCACAHAALCSSSANTESMHVHVSVYPACSSVRRC